MLLPQSSAFAALKNRLNSVSNIGLLHSGPRAYVNPANKAPSSSTPSPFHNPLRNHYRRRSTEAYVVPGWPNSPANTAYDRPTGSRLKGREESAIRWVELLDKFKNVQEKARRSRISQRHIDHGGTELDFQNPSLAAALSAAAVSEQARGNFKEKTLPDVPRGGAGGLGISGSNSRDVISPDGATGPRGASTSAAAHKSRTSLSNLGRLGIGARKSKR